MVCGCQTHMTDDYYYMLPGYPVVQVQDLVYPVHNNVELIYHIVAF